MKSPSELATIWDKITGALRTILPPGAYELWAPKFTLLDDSGEVLTLYSEDAMASLWVESSYKDSFVQAAMLALGEPREFRFAIPENTEDCDQSEKRKKESTVPESTAPVVVTTSTKPVKKPSEKAKSSASGKTLLNDLYTFDSFVVYDESNFAYKAGQSIAQTQRALFNPLFLYGKSGVGKTHLLQAIGHDVLAKAPSAHVVYVTGEQFANEFIEASRSLNGQNFTKLRRKYRKADVLLVDDIQFIAGKDKTVEEFLHTFDALFQAHKTIVLSSDAAACDIANLDPRLAARMESGLTVELVMPNEDARLEILQSKRDRAHMNVSDEILKFLANKIQKSIRRLEGALLRVATFTSLAGVMPDIEKTEQLLRDILREENVRVLSLDTIQKKVADFYELKVSDLTGKRRPNSIAFPRQIAMYLSRQMTDCSLKDIGAAFGGRDHGTVIHANKLVAAKIESDSRIRDIVLKLQEELSN